MLTLLIEEVEEVQRGQSQHTVEDLGKLEFTARWEDLRDHHPKPPPQGAQNATPGPAASAAQGRASGTPPTPGLLLESEA